MIDNFGILLYQFGSYDEYTALTNAIGRLLRKFGEKRNIDSLAVSNPKPVHNQFHKKDEQTTTGFNTDRDASKSLKPHPWG